MIKIRAFLVMGFFVFCPILALADGDKKTDTPEKESVELDPKLVFLPAFRIPVIQNRSLETYYIVDLRILAASPEKAILVLARRPVLVDALFRDLYAVLGVSWHGDYHIDLQNLKKRMHTLCTSIMGPGVIDGILIQQFNIQKTRQKKSKGA